MKKFCFRFFLIILCIFNTVPIKSFYFFKQLSEGLQVGSKECRLELVFKDFAKKKERDFTILKESIKKLKKSKIKESPLIIITRYRNLFRHNFKDNKYFIDEIVPLLIGDEPSDEEDVIKFLYKHFAENSYIMQNAFYVYNVSGIQHIVDQRLCYRDPSIEEYLKLYLTPPDFMVHNVQKKVREKMFAYMLCLKRISKQCNIGFRFPKPVLYQYILKPLIEHATPEKYKIYAQNRKEELDTIIDNSAQKSQQYALLGGMIGHLDKLCKEKEDKEQLFKTNIGKVAEKHKDLLSILLQCAEYKVETIDYKNIQKFDFVAIKQKAAAVFNETFINNIINPYCELKKKHLSERADQNRVIDEHIKNTIHTLFKIKEGELYRQKYSYKDLAELLLARDIEKFNGIFMSDEEIRLIPLCRDQFKEWAKSTIDLTHYIFDGMTKPGQGEK